MSLSKRTIVVTGGSKGIGRAICLRFAREGARIVFVHYDPDDLAEKKTLELLGTMNVEVVSEKLNVSSFQDVE